MPPLPRELVRWIQTLDLPIAIRLPKRDLSNGYLFAEMCARYWQGVELHGFENKLSKHNKEANWKLLRKYFSKNRFEVDDALIQAVIACDDGAAEQLLFRLYTALTKREIQMFLPLNEPEVDHVPVFVKQALVAKKDHNSGAAQASSDEAQQKHAAEERQRQEAQQKRLEAQQRQQGSKPKTLAKTQGIQSADKDEEDGHVHHLVQFSSVTVKPLPPQLVARFGASKLSSEGNGGGGGSGGVGGGGGAGGGAGASAGNDGAVGVISKQLAEALDAMDIAPWATSAALPTLAEYFYKNLSSFENSLRSALWSRLMAQSEEVAAAICKRPSEMAAFAEISAPHLRQCAAIAAESAATGGGAQAVSEGAADPAAASSSSSSPPSLTAAPQYGASGVVKRYYETVTALVSSTNPGAALHGLSHGLLPVLRGMSPLSAAAADVLGDVVLAHIRLGSSGSASTPLASTFFSALYDGVGCFCRTDFLLLLHAVLKGFVVAPKRAAVAVPSVHPDLDDGGGAASADRIRGRIDDATSSVSYYNAVAGLYAESPSERLASLRLLTRLVELGCSGQVLRQHHLGELVEGVWNGTAAVTQTNEGMVLFSRFIVELMAATLLSSAQGGGAGEEFQPQLQRAVVELNRFALDPSHHLSQPARQVLLFYLSQALHIFPLTDTRGTSTTVALVRHLMSATDLGSADLNPLLAATPVVVFRGRVCGTIRIHSVLTQVCPLRCVNAILALTAADIASGGGGGTTTPKNAAATSSSDRRGSSTTLSKSAARIIRTGDTAELGLARLRWVQALFSSQEAGTLSARTQGTSISDDDLVTAWWSVVKALEPTLSLALFTAELLHGQITAAASNAKIAAQLPAEAVCQQVFFIASLAQNVLARLYIDFSGSVDPLPRSREGYDELRCDPQLASKAAEWFNQVVVGS